MADTNWPQLAAALGGGGAFGAILTASITAYRARRQPVGRRIDVVPVFRPSNDATDLEAAIAITHDAKTVTFKNLFITSVQVVNRGNRDLDELRFGATLGEGDRCIFVESMAPDRHHKVDQSPPVCPDGPQKEIDFVLRPFNRGDSYSFKFYVVIPDDRKEPAEMALGSASPIRFVEMPTVGEMLARTVSETVAVGPFTIGLRR